jgi:CheY-like chemotaxis protein
VAGESVLVVEDTELLRRIYTDKLSQEGYKVFQAADGLECLNVVRTQALDLILLDLVMPRMSGLEALEALKRDPRTKKIPVIILSNLGQDTDIQRGLDLGAVDYLIKNSAKPADVSAKIQATLAIREDEPDETLSFQLRIKDHEADADAFVDTRTRAAAGQARLVRRSPPVSLVRAGVLARRPSTPSILLRTASRTRAAVFSFEQAGATLPALYHHTRPPTLARGADPGNTGRSRIEGKTRAEEVTALKEDASCPSSP